MAEKYLITISEVKLLCKGKVLKDHLPITDYKITEADLINADIPAGASTGSVSTASGEERKEEVR